MDVESRLKIILAVGLRRIRGPLQNADDYPSVLTLFITMAGEVKTHKVTQLFNNNISSSRK